MGKCMELVKKVVHYNTGTVEEYIRYGKPGKVQAEEVRVRPLRGAASPNRSVRELGQQEIEAGNAQGLVHVLMECDRDVMVREDN